MSRDDVYLGVRMPRSRAHNGDALALFDEQIVRECVAEQNRAQIVDAGIDGSGDGAHVHLA